MMLVSQIIAYYLCLFEQRGRITIRYTILLSAVSTFVAFYAVPRRPGDENGRKIIKRTRKHRPRFRPESSRSPESVVTGNHDRYRLRQRLHRAPVFVGRGLLGESAAIHGHIGTVRRIRVCFTRNKRIFDDKRLRSFVR